LRFTRVLILFVFSCAIAITAAAQPVAAVYVSAPAVQVVSGDTEQLTAFARDANGNLVSNAVFQWSSNNTKVISVDSGGQLSAGSLGIADVTAAANGRTGVVRLQVLPQQVVVTPANPTIPYAAQQQFSAVALNLQGQPITDATFTWHAMYGGGAGDSATLAIDKTGLLSANTLGYYLVRAAVVYAGQTDQFQREFDGSTPIAIIPTDYAVAPLASSSNSLASAHVIGKRSTITANDSGQLVFSAYLDGLTSGLFTWQNQSLGILATAGTPGLVPGTVIFDMDIPSVDSQGNVVAFSSTIGAGNNISMVNAQGLQVIVPASMAADAVLDVNIASTTRYSLSDNGDLALRGNFHYPNSTVNYQGILRYNQRFGMTLEASSKDPLPGLTGTVSFDDQYGLDANGALYFSANAGSGRAIYQKRPLMDAVKVVAIGDTLSGSTVTQCNQIALSPTGDLVIRGALATGQQFLARYIGGDIADPPTLMLLTTGYVSNVYAANAKGGIVANGDFGSGYGLYLWGGGASPAKLILARNAASPTGEPVADFYSAAVDGSGNVYATIRGVDAAWMLVQAAPSPKLIASNGTLIATQANLDLYPSLVIGARTGPLHVMAGGGQPSIFQADSKGLLPALVVGDRLPGGANYYGSNFPRKAPSGDLYVTADIGVYRLSNTGDSVIAAFNYTFPDGVVAFSPFNVAVNDHNQVAMVSGTDHSHQRLMFFDGTTLKTIAYFNGGPPYITASPGGGNFSNMNDFAVNDSGQVMINASVAGGPNGLFLFDGSSWQTACLVGSCKLGTDTVSSFTTLRASGSQFCSQFSTSAGNQRIDCWSAGTWTNILKRGDPTSDGTQINFVSGTYDINRKGDVVVVLNTGLNANGIFMKTGDTGSFATVLCSLFPTVDNAYLAGIYSVDLRDDRRVFFNAQDFMGRVIAYEADPQL
jgi:hypothetical protein